jgi:hypothetical protein
MKTLILLLSLTTIPALANTKPILTCARMGHRNLGRGYLAVVSADQANTKKMEVEMCKLWHGSCLGDEGDIQETYSVADDEGNYRGEHVSLTRSANGGYELQATSRDVSQSFVFTAQDCQR